MKSHLVKKWSAEQRKKTKDKSQKEKDESQEEKKMTKSYCYYKKSKKSFSSCCCQLFAKSYVIQIFFYKGNMNETQECDRKGIFQFILFYILRFVVI